VRRFLDKKRTVALWDLRWREKCAAQGAFLANVRNIGYATGSMDAAPLTGHAMWRCCRSWGPPVRKGNQTRSRRTELAAVKKESEAGLREQIRCLLRKPMAERTHFLRKRLPGGGSTL
jgi:hypothetical protein